MSQNSNEYVIPDGKYNQDPVSSDNSSEDLNLIYSKIGNVITPAYFQSHPERPKNPELENILYIGSDLAKARVIKLESQSTNRAIGERKFIKSVAKQLFRRKLSLKPLTESDLKNQESEIGAKIFGKHDSNIVRGFWNDSPEDWYYHQSITGAAGVIDDLTLHYEVSPTNVLMISNKKEIPNSFIAGKELENFTTAAKIYHDRVMNQIYSDDDQIAA